MDINSFYDNISNKQVPTTEYQSSLRDIVDKYPFFQGGVFMYLKSLYLYGDYGHFQKELNRIGIFVNDRKALFYYIFSEEYKRFFEKTGKSEIKEDRTGLLLNAFFNTMDIREEDTQLEYTISNSSLASNDYFSYISNIERRDIPSLLEESPNNPLKHQNIIDSFIQKSEGEGGIHFSFNKEENSINTVQPIKEDVTEDDLTDDMFFTETLAKIYIKQKKYEKAYKIIKHLSLNYPKKNIYFADQLSFLEKLIINSKYKKQ